MKRGGNSADGSPRVEPHRTDAAGLLVLGGQHHGDPESTEDEERPERRPHAGMVVKLET